MLRDVARVRTVLKQLPELVLRLPLLDPFFGSDAQGVPQRDFLCYCDVEPLFVEPGSAVGRHEMLRAIWLDEDNNKHLCVLKGFDHGDEKRLRRELGVLSRLRHPNLLPLQASSEPHFHASYAIAHKVSHT